MHRVLVEDVLCGLDINRHGVQLAACNLTLGAPMEAALGGRQGRRPSYVRKADGEFEARLVALSCAEPPEGHSQWSLIGRIL